MLLRLRAPVSGSFDRSNVTYHLPLVEFLRDAWASVVAILDGRPIQLGHLDQPVPIDTPSLHGEPRT